MPIKHHNSLNSVKSQKSVDEHHMLFKFQKQNQQIIAGTFYINSMCLKIGLILLQQSQNRNKYPIIFSIQILISNNVNLQSAFQINCKALIIMGLEQEVTKAIEVAGNKGRYQFIIVALLSLIFYFDAFALQGATFYFMDPTFICDGSDEIVDELEACDRLAECHITNDFTITKFMGLYCDRQGERDAIQALLSIGSLVGLIVMNVVSDIRGRKFVLIIDLVIAVLGSLFTIIGAYAQNTPLLAFASFLCGFSGYSLVIVSYIMVGDVCQETMRQRTNLLLNVSYSLGLITYFFMYNWINQWYNVVYLFMFFPFLGLTIVCMILVEESPNYFMCSIKDRRKCVNAVTNIAIYNGKSEEDIQKIQAIIMDAKMSEEDIEKQTKKTNIITVMKQWKYLKIMLCMGAVLGGGNMFFYGIQYAIDDIGFSYGADNLVLGCTEIVLTLVIIRFIVSLKRKRTILISYCFTIIISLLFIFKAINKSEIACTILIIAIRVSTTTGYYMVVMIQTESFPLEIQSIGAGTIQAISQLGSTAAPLLIAFAINQGFEKMATMGVVFAVLLVPLKFVPEPPSQVKTQDLSESLLESQLEQPKNES